MNTGSEFTCYPEASKSANHCAITDTRSQPKDGFRPMLVVTGVALCLVLTSCLASYEPRGYDQTAVYRPGYQVSTLPAGYRSEVISGRTYYYHQGYYYRPSPGGYIVVDAPRRSRYYADYGRRHQAYQPDSRLDPMAYNRDDQRYERGDILTSLPRGYRRVKHRSKLYYQVGERYYQRQDNIFVVVSRPY